MGEQVERVLDAAGAFERSRVDGDAEVFGELLPVEPAAVACKLDGAFEQTTIHVVRDEALAERRQCALRERRLVVAEHAEHHLPAGVDNRQLDGLGVRLARVRLEQEHHREQRGRNRLLALAGRAVHPLQLDLEGIVEQLMALLAQKREQLARPSHAPNQEPLALAQRDARKPTHHCDLRGAGSACGGKRSSGLIGVDPLQPSARGDRGKRTDRCSSPAQTAAMHDLVTELHALSENRYPAPCLGLDPFRWTRRVRALFLRAFTLARVSTETGQDQTASGRTTS